ncbi:MAG: hypothetical protein GEV28_19285 [Actinophytocola sp.]|uniref:hypothetical protein n=1 Tax=Actinophytocola sp. TaxID=1872138 RepID=UPI00132A1F1B|nr:hypothetical protein [Actinophytocola sp.]MPZ82422.1 hypothetical protein [Actinophytocola sp.]
MSEFGPSNGWHHGRMADRLSDADIDEIEQRVKKALEVAPAPWTVFLETRHAIGGSSFVQVGDADLEVDHEMYVDVHVGDGRWSSPDPRLDAVTDLLGHAPEDIRLLLQEIRRIRMRQA